MSFESMLVIKTTAILACAGLAAGLLRDASASTRHAIWTLALLSMLVLPAAALIIPTMARVELPLLPLEEDPSQEPSYSFSETQKISLAAPNPAVDHAQAPVDKTEWPLRVYLDIGWVAGFLLVFSRFVAATIAARRLVHNGDSVVDSEWIRLKNDLRARLSVAANAEIRIGGKTPPITWGLLRSAILLPAAANEWSADRRRAVLAHELAHVKRHDALFQFLIQLACSVYWFNPLVWVAERRMRLERERACDDYVLSLGTSPIAYADHLLELATTGNPTPASVGMAHSSQLETRLFAILSLRLRRRSLSRGAAVLLLSALISVMLFLTVLQVTPMLSITSRPWRHPLCLH